MIFAYTRHHLVGRASRFGMGKQPIMCRKHLFADQPFEAFLPLPQRLNSCADGLFRAAEGAKFDLARNVGVVFGLQFDGVSASGHCDTRMRRA